MGKLIVIEGLDGSGKATQAKKLAEQMNKLGIKTRQISFPDYESESSALVKMYLRGAFGKKPEDVNAYAASSFYAVDRFASFKKSWECDWKQGLIVADRYTTSNAIHQCCKLEKCKWDQFINWLFDYEYNLLGIPAPNLVVYLRLDPAVSQMLMNKRYGGMESKKDIHEKNMDYLERCHYTADYCAKTLGWKTIECSHSGCLRSVESIQSEIQGIVSKLL